MPATTIIILMLFGVPPILWTGALTPILTESVTAENNLLKYPQYSNGSNVTWTGNNRLGVTDCNVTTNTHGIFGSCPVSIIQSTLLNRAAQATSNLTQTHTKNDNSHYSYVGRSYGVGSSVGIFDETLSSGYGTPKLLSYNYTEPGYLTSVTCFHNASSDFHLELIQKGRDKYGIPYIYYATGRFPHANEGQNDFFAVTGILGDSNIAVVAAKKYGGRSVIMVTAGSNYLELNATQCEVSFASTFFTVGVDVTNRLIKVTPVNTTESLDSIGPLFDPTAGLALSVINQVNGLSMISTSLYTSVVGDALVTNIEAAKMDKVHPNPDAFTSMGDSFSAMIDEILLFMASSQLFIPNGGFGDFSTVGAHLTIQAVELGEFRYTMATFAVCAVLLLAVCFEACRTRFWKWLPQWDFMDTKSLVLSSATAGTDILSTLCLGRGIRKVDWMGSDLIKRDGKKPQPVPDVRLRLGRKVIQTVPGKYSTVGNGYQDELLLSREEQAVQVRAVSLWASGCE
ncbi:MAG: hypothetical protein Q9209_004727 [Squamulea sp. 1 TL-2023]